MAVGLGPPERIQGSASVGTVEDGSVPGTVVRMGKPLFEGFGAGGGAREERPAPRLPRRLLQAERSTRATHQLPETRFRSRVSVPVPVPTPGPLCFSPLPSVILEKGSVPTGSRGGDLSGPGLRRPLRVLSRPRRGRFSLDLGR